MREEELTEVSMVVAVDASEEESPVRLFAQKCEQGLLTHPSVLAAAVFVNHAAPGGSPGGSPGGIPGFSAVGEEQRGGESGESVATLWGAVLILLHV